MKVKSAISKSKRQQNIFYFCMMVLPLLQFFIFYICVNFNSVLLAFREYDYDTGRYIFTGFDNFRQFFVDLKDVVYLKAAIKNSFIVFAFVLVVGISLSLIFSYYLYKKSLFSGVFKVTLYLPTIVASITLVTMFKYFAERAYPEICLQLFGKEAEGLLANYDTTFWTILFYTIWAGFGTQILMFSGAMNGISDSIIEAAKLDGASAFKEFWYIVIPMIWPTLTTFIIITVAGIFTNQMNLFSFYGTAAEYRLYTFGYYLYRAVKSTNTTVAEYPYLSAVGILLTIVSVPLVYAVKFLLEKFGPNRE